ncbi:unnamed protein product [marine sediment metagenome]|uniref:Uncharacterized protein n=1 Tax=marine sediment metagenome TaxID=412755 RepID=X0S4M2_9ZZZZ
MADGSVDGIARSITAEIARQVDRKVQAILEEGGKDEWIAWFQTEVEHWKTRCEELEMELLMLENSYEVNPIIEIQPKNRGLF